MSTQLTVQQAPMFGLSTLEEAVNFAGQMAKANLLPTHLKGSPADCLRVVMQAARWQMDPFSVADKTSVISGKLMYEGQLVSAVVNARGNLSKRLDYKFEGEGEKRVLTVTGTLKGEQEPREITLDVAMAKRINKNGQMNQNPDQQMCYIGARMWARRHTSELMLGVYTPDEIDPDSPTADPENVTPAAERPAPKPRAARGAAAAKEVVVPAEAVPEQAQSEQTVEQAMQAREKKLAPVNGDQVQAELKERGTVLEPKAAPAAAPEPRAFLKDGEKLEAVIKLESLQPTFMTVEGKRCAGFKGVASGGFNGDVRCAIGGTATGPLNEKGLQTTMTINAPFEVGKPLNAVLHGKKSTAPAGTPLHGLTLVWIESATAVQAEEVA